MVNTIIRFFATLCFAQNDNYLDIKGQEVGSGGAASNLLTLSNAITCCHSERSEESLIFPRTVGVPNKRLLIFFTLCNLVFWCLDGYFFPCHQVIRTPGNTK
jgi:hypothetical protein